MKISILTKIHFYILATFYGMARKRYNSLEKQLYKMEHKSNYELFDWYYAIRRKFKRKKNDTSSKR